MEVQFSYTFGNNWYIQTDPTITYSWNASSGERWTVPAGLDIGKVFVAGGQSFALQVGSYYYLQKPEGAPNWVLRAQLSWVF